MKSFQSGIISIGFFVVISGISITADKIATILKAAGVSVEPYWPTLFAKALDGIDVGSLLGSLGSAASAVSAGEEHTRALLRLAFAHANMCRTPDDNVNTQRTSEFLNSFPLFKTGPVAGGGGGAAAAAAPTAAEAAEEVKEEKKAESDEESDEDMGFSLFD